MVSLLAWNMVDGGIEPRSGQKFKLKNMHCVFQVYFLLQTYDCHSQLPISYCNEDILYVRLKPNWNDIRASNSQIRITVTSTLLYKYGEKYSTKSISDSKYNVSLHFYRVMNSLFIVTFSNCSILL